MFDDSDESADGTPEIGPPMLLRENELVRNAELVAAQESRMAWHKYAAAATLHRLKVEPTVGTDAEVRVVDPFAECAARFSAAQGITHRAAELQINRGLALRDRLPEVNALLKAGRVHAQYIPDIVTRTDLIDGSEHMAEIDSEIAEHLQRRGSWSRSRLRDMVDTTIFRRDPDLVRNNHEDAKKNRGVWGAPAEHGMAVLDAHGTAEEMTMIMARLEELAMSTCKADPRRKGDRMADALFATVMGREFYCQCPDDPKHPCTAEITTLPADHVVSGIDVKIVLHVITDQATVDGTATNPGFLDGHGVISGDHVREIANRPEVITRPIGNTLAPPGHTEPAIPERAEPQPAQENPVQAESAPRAAPGSRPDPDARPGRGTVYMRAPENPVSGECSCVADGPEAPFPQLVPLPATLPGDRYRPSAVLDSYIRIRDVYCMWPGCNRNAWGADLDHTCEYNHDNPDAGGCTHPSEMKTLCRFHHLMKTYSDWLDDQYPDAGTSRPRLIFTTPEGRHYPGPAWTGDDLFPTLKLIVFDDQRGSPTRPPPGSRPGSPPAPPSRTQPRTAAKHARRQQERLANRRQRELQEQLARDVRDERGRNSPPPTF